MSSSCSLNCGRGHLLSTTFFKEKNKIHEDFPGQNLISFHCHCYQSNFLMQKRLDVGMDAAYPHPKVLQRGTVPSASPGFFHQSCPVEQSLCLMSQNITLEPYLTQCPRAHTQKRAGHYMESWPIFSNGRTS